MTSPNQILVEHLGADPQSLASILQQLAANENLCIHTRHSSMSWRCLEVGDNAVGLLCGLAILASGAAPWELLSVCRS